MTIVADVLATFRGDTSDLEASANRAGAVVGSIGDKAGGMAPAFAEGAKSASDLAEKLSAGGAAMDEMGDVGERAFGGIKNAIIPIIGAAGLGGIVDLAKNTTMELQTLGVQFDAAFKGSGSSALQSSIKDANDFGVSIAAAGSAYEGLGLVTKGSSQQIQSDFKAAADGAAGLGMSVDNVAGMLTNYYQLVQRVGGTGGTANRAATALLTSNLIDPATANQLRLQANQGANAQTLLDTINSDIEGRFGGAGKKQADTLSGQVQVFKNQFSDSSASALSPVIGGLQSGLTDINKDMSTAGFKQATEDITQFVGAMVKGVTIIEPFAKDVAEMALETAHFVTEIRPVGEILGVVVAGLLAWQAINIVQDIVKTVSGVTSLADSETGLLSSLTASTAAMEAQTAAAEKMFAVMAAGGAESGAGMSMGAGAGLVPIAKSSAPSDSEGGASPAAAGLSDAETSTMMTKMGSWMLGSGAGVITLIGSQLIGHLVGGPTGSAISGIGGMAGAGALVGSMAGPEGTLIGAGIGAAAGVFQTALGDAANAAQDFTDKVNSDEKNDVSKYPIGSTAASINSAYSATHHGFGARSAVEGYVNDNPQQSQADIQYAQETAGARYNETQNLGDIAKKNGLSLGASEQFATKNNIDLSQPLAANVNAINNATTALQQLGGAAEFSAEQVSSSYNTIAAQVSGQYGESSANAGSLISQYGKAQGLNSSQSQSQFFNLAGQAGVDLGTMGITPQSINSTTTQLPGGGSTPDITPQEAQLKNQMLSVTLQYTQALQGEAEASFAVGQAAFSVGQAYFSESQAVFSAEQAMFSFGRAILANTVAQVTQSDATAASTTALTEGYLPANANIAASLAQVTSLTSAQVNAINTEVASYNQLEAAMYGSVGGAQSLFDTYTELNGAVQELQAQTQQYQNLLNEPLDGSKEYSAQQEQYKVQEAAVQQQIDTLELQRVPTNDPRIQTLQAQLALLQAQADLSTQINTQGVGQQQFQIQQAQLGPSQSDATQMAAATAMGQLNVQLLAAQQALAPVNASYVDLNTQLSVAQQRNSAVTSALQAQAQADQGSITANNSLIVAANGVTTAANGVVTAQNAVKTALFNQTTAEWGLQTAVVNVEQATNTFASTLQGNIATALTEIQGFITSIGVSFTSVAQQMSQAQVIMGELTVAQLAGNTQLIGVYQDLQKMVSSGPITQAQLLPFATSINPNTLLPQAASGANVAGTGAVNVHDGEIILPAQVAAQIRNDGGTMLQQQVGAALVNGIESDGSPTELAGGIGPAAGLFQFEPQTWLGDGGGAYAPIAQDATWQQQVQVFVNATKGNYFGSWGPDLGAGYGYTGGPIKGSKVADMIQSFPPSMFANGGFVPGSGPVNATLHGGEFVLSNAMLAALGNGASPGSGALASGGGGKTLSLEQGAVQVNIEISGEGVSSLSSTLQNEIENSINDAFEQVLMKMGGGN